MMTGATDGMMVEARTGIRFEIVIGTNGIGAMGERDHIQDLYHPDPDSHHTEPGGAQGASNARTSVGGETEGRAWARLGLRHGPTPLGESSQRMTLSKFRNGWPHRQVRMGHHLTQQAIHSSYALPLHEMDVGERIVYLLALLYFMSGSSSSSMECMQRSCSLHVLTDVQRSLRRSSLPLISIKHSSIQINNSDKT